MAAVELNIGGRCYTVACRDGGEAHLTGLAMRVDAKAEEARAAVGNVNEVRQLLFAALLLADEAHDGAALSDTPALDASLAALAARIEAIADALESSADAS